jgi:uncharacterized Zn-binding protein involved in type VI secretion
MPPAARMGDVTGHPGTIMSGVPTVLIEGRPAATVGTLHTCTLPPPVGPHPPSTILPPGCPTVLIGGQFAARMGDMAGCGAPIVSGAVTVRIGG